MLARRMLLALATLPVAAAAQTRPRYYQRGTKDRVVRFAGADGATLEGTLLLPIWTELERVPGVVLVAGSGPTDRDGNNPLVPERIDLLRQVAERLAEAGIASLRYDKRGTGGSTAMPQGTLAEQQRFFAWDNFTADVVAAHAELVRHDEIKTYATALLGHSEGGLLVLAAAPAITRYKPHAMVLMGTPGRPLGDVLRAQIERNAPPALPLPCLLLQGAADRQVVPMGDIQPLIDALGRRSAPGEVAVIAANSHNFKIVASPADPGFGGPLSPALAETLVRWLARTLGA